MSNTIAPPDAWTDMMAAVGRVQALERELQVAMMTRDQAIIRVSEAGASRAQVAQATGLTRGRIQQVIAAQRRHAVA